MPPRWLCLGILAFWVATSGYLFWLELWPTIQPNEPPPFVIDLVDEAQQNIPTPIRWNFYEAGTLVPTVSLPRRAVTCLGLLATEPGAPHALVATVAEILTTEPERPSIPIAKTWVEYREQPDDSFS